MDKLHINANKISTLKYFLARFPYISDKTGTCDIIIQGFIDVGMLYAKKVFGLIFMQFKKQREEVLPDMNENY